MRTSILFCFCLIISLSSVFAAARKSDIQAKSDRERQEFLKRAAEVKTNSPTQGLQAVIIPETKKELPGPVVCLKNGKTIDGRIIDSQPATVTIRTTAGAELKMLVEDLALKSQTNLPPSISAIYNDYVKMKESAEKLLEVSEQSAKVFESSTNLISGLIQEKKNEIEAKRIREEKRVQGKEIQVLETSLKVINQYSTDTEFSWLVVLESLLNKDMTGRLEITFLDEEGFKIDSDDLYDITIRAGEKNQFSDKSLLNTKAFKSIKKTSVSFERH